MFVLTLIYAFNFIDRQIIGILSPFIKADLGLDDAQLSWLKGIYFALLYTVLGIPIAWLADRFSRVNIVAISLTLWSGFTAASGLAGNFTQFLIILGVINGTAYAGGVLVDKWGKTNRRAYGLVPALALVVGAPAYYFSLQVESLELSIALVTILLFTSGFYLGCKAFDSID